MSGFQRDPFQTIVQRIQIYMSIFQSARGPFIFIVQSWEDLATSPVPFIVHRGEDLAICPAIKGISSFL